MGLVGSTFNDNMISYHIINCFYFARVLSVPMVRQTILLDSQYSVVVFNAGFPSIPFYFKMLIFFLLKTINFQFIIGFVCLINRCAQLMYYILIIQTYCAILLKFIVLYLMDCLSIYFYFNLPVYFIVRLVRRAHLFIKLYILLFKLHGTESM